MSTVTSTAPRLITPTDEPIWPCWLWFAPDGGAWKLHAEKPRGKWSDISTFGYTHWMPATPPAPPEKPQQSVDPLTPEDRKLVTRAIEDYLTSFPAGFRPLITNEQVAEGLVASGIAAGRKLAKEQVADEIAGYKRDRNTAVEHSATLEREIERLKCAHSDMADLYAKSQQELARLKDAHVGVVGFHRDELRQRCAAEAEVNRLKGQLEAAEQHVKILTCAAGEAVP